LDPFKKAESIDSILETISLVQDVIKRSVFITEAARLFKMSEEAFTESLNKKIFERLRKPKPRSEAGNVANEPSAVQSFGPQNEPPVFIEQASHKTPLFELEEVLIRSLILFGHKPIEDDFLVANYILEQVEELQLKSEFFQKVRVEYAEKLEFGEEMSPDYFLHHPEEGLKRMIIDLCAEFYQLSTNWENKYKIVIPTEEDLLANALYFNIVQLKKQHVLDDIHKLQIELENLPPEEDDFEILKLIMEKKSIEVALSKELGSVMN
jgi:DNA primase